MTQVHQTDLVNALIEDHIAVKGLFGRFDSLPTSEWEDAFCDLRVNLVQHEVAEEEIVYPAFRRAMPDGGDIADARIAEQSMAEETLAQMEDMGVLADGFKALLEQLRDDVLAHAEKEEAQVFPVLRTSLDPKELHKLGELYERAKSAAPTHPHPHAPDTPPGNLLLGPVAALVDRVRDTMRGVGSHR